MQGMLRTSQTRGLCCTTDRLLGCSSSSSLGYMRFLTSQALYLEEEPARLHPHYHDETSLQSVRRKNNSELPQPKIGRLVLVRHGQSVWNVTDPTRNLTARFVSCAWSSNAFIWWYLNFWFYFILKHICICPNFLNIIQIMIDRVGRHWLNTAR